MRSTCFFCRFVDQSQDRWLETEPTPELRREMAAYIRKHGAAFVSRNLCVQHRGVADRALRMGAN